MSKALVDGVFNEHLEVVRRELEAGAWVDFRSTKNSTPLIYAAWRGNIVLCELLVSPGADVNAINDEGKTPLLVAAWRGLQDICGLLLRSGAGANIKGQHDWTPLMRAAHSGHVDVCYLLIMAGADHEAKNNSGRTVFDFNIRSEVLSAISASIVERETIGMVNGAGRKVRSL